MGDMIDYNVMRIFVLLNKTFNRESMKELPHKAIDIRHIAPTLKIAL